MAFKSLLSITSYIVGFYCFRIEAAAMFGCDGFNSHINLSRLNLCNLALIGVFNEIDDQYDSGLYVFIASIKSILTNLLSMYSLSVFPEIPEIPEIPEFPNCFIRSLFFSSLLLR